MKRLTAEPRFTAVFGRAAHQHKLHSSLDAQDGCPTATKASPPARKNFPWDAKQYHFQDFFSYDVNAPGCCFMCDLCVSPILGQPQPPVHPHAGKHFICTLLYSTHKQMKPVFLVGEEARKVLAGGSNNHAVNQYAFFTTILLYNCYITIILLYLYDNNQF